MPKKYGVKEKDLVVAHVVNMVLTGKLRSGDRIDRNEIAQELGLSRVPIQEAVVQLEHDGTLSTRYHRGAFVERFDEAFIREHHELHGCLTAMASARAAADQQPAVIDRLSALTETLRNTRESRAFYDAAWQYRTVITDAYAGPRLAALIRSVQAFAPRTFWVGYLSNHDEMLPYYEDETMAIRGGDQAGAHRACVDRSELMGRLMLAELVRRGVLRAAGAPSVAF